VDGCALATCHSDFYEGTLGYKSRNMYCDMCPSGDGPLDNRGCFISFSDVLIGKNKGLPYIWAYMVPDYL
jgi:hypothetical protein